MLFRRATGATATAARAFSTSAPRSVARISIIGNLADTPEVIATNSGREILKYAVASNSGPKDNRQTSWFRVTSFAEGPRKDYLMGLPKGYVSLVKPPQPYFAPCGDYNKPHLFASISLTQCCAQYHGLC